VKGRATANGSAKQTRGSSERRMIMSRNVSKITTVEQQLDLIVKNLAVKFPAGTTLLHGGAARTVEDLVKSAAEYRDGLKAVRDADAVATTARATRNQQEPERKMFLRELRPVLETAFGTDSEELRSFGFKPRKPARKLTGEELVARKEKSDQTREENH